MQGDGLHESLGVNCWRPGSESCVGTRLVGYDNHRETSRGLPSQYVEAVGLSLSSTVI
jgi:hypothetical protein